MLNKIHHNLIPPFQLGHPAFSIALYPSILFSNSETLSIIFFKDVLTILLFISWSQEGHIPVKLFNSSPQLGHFLTIPINSCFLTLVLSVTSCLTPHSEQNLLPSFNYFPQL